MAEIVRGVLMRAVQGGREEFGVFRGVLRGLEGYLVEEVKGETGRRDQKDVFLYTLSCLIAEDHQSKDIDLPTVKSLLKPQSPSPCYLTLLTHQYLLYLNWLAMQTLFQPTSETFIKNY